MTFAEHALEEALRDLIESNPTIAARLGTVPATVEQDEDATEGCPFGVFIGLDDSGVDYSGVFISSGSAESIAGPNLTVGAFMVQFNVKVFTRMIVEDGTDTGRATHKSNCSAVWSVLRDSAFCDNLRTAGAIVLGASGQDVLRLRGRNSTVTNGCRVMEFQCELPICDNA